MMYEVFPSTQFKKDLKNAKSRGKNIDLITKVIEKLANGEQLPEKYRDHQLTASRNYNGKMRECHIQPDWLLVYESDDNKLYLYLTRTGSHSDLF